MKSKPTLAHVSSLFAAVLMMVTSASAAVFVKADNSDALNLTTSWTNNALPGASDIAQWDNTVTALNTTNSLGANLAWGGLKIINPSAAIYLRAGNTVTNGANGLDMSSATVDLVLSNTMFIAPGVLQQWNVAGGRTLTVSAVPTKPGQPSNNTGVLQVGTTGTVKFGTAAAPFIADNQNNPWITYGANDWAALDSSGTVIAASYAPATTGLTAATNNDIQADLPGGASSAVDCYSIRFNDPTARTLNIANSGTARTLTARGVLVTANSGGGVIGGSVATSFIRPSRSTIANTSFNIIQNSPADFTISANIANGSSSAPTHLVKSGPGNLILTHTGNGYSGGTDINGGTLTAAAGASLGGGGVTVNNTGRLIVNASNTTFVAGVTVNSGGTNSIKIGTAGAQQYIPTVTFNAGSTRCEFNYAGGIAPSVTTAPLITSTLTANGTIAMDIYNNSLTIGVYPLIKYTNSSGTGFAAFSLGFLPPHILGYLSNDTVNTSISLVVTNINQPIHWAVGNAAWDINTSSNWQDTLANSAAYQEVITPYSSMGDSVLFNDSASGGSPITVSLNMAVAPASMSASNNSKAYTISGTGSIGGVGAFTKSGSGTLVLGTANSFTGGLNLNAGTITFSALTNLGAGSINFGGGTLQFASGNVDDISVRTVTLGAGGGTINDGGNTITFTKPIGNNGAGGLTKTGVGALNLSGTNKYFGLTVISNGTLTLGANTYISNSAAIIVQSGAVLDATAGSLGLSSSASQILAGSGTINGAVTANNGTTISPSTNGVVGTLTFGNDLTLAGGTYACDISTNSHDLIVVNGNLTLNSGSILTIQASNLTNGTYRLIQYSGGLLSGAGSSANLVISGFSQSGKVAALSDATYGEIDLVVTTQGGTNLTWLGNDPSLPNNWDIETTTNFTNSAGVPASFVQGDKVTFNDVSANPNVNLMAALQPGAVTVSSDVNNYTFNDGAGGGAGKLTGSGGITKNGASTLTIATANLNSGPTVINGGTVQIGNGGSLGDLGSGNVTNNGALVFYQNNAHTVSGAISGSGSILQQGSDLVTLAANNTYSGPTTIASGGLQVGTGGATGSLGSGAITNDGNLILNRTGTFSLGPILNGPNYTGYLTVLGAGTVTLNGVSTYVGNTYISNGVVKLGASEAIPSSVTQPSSSALLYLDGGATFAGTLDLNGFNQTVNALSGTANTVNSVITNSAASGTSTLTVLGNTATTFRGYINDNTNAGRISLVVLGGNQLDLRQFNSYSGGTFVGENAILGVHTNSAAGIGGIVLSNNATLNMTGAGSSADPSVFPGNVVTIVDNATANFTSTQIANGFAGTIVGNANATANISGSTTVSFSANNAKQMQGFSGTLRIQPGSTLRFSANSIGNGGDSTSFDVQGTLTPKSAGTITMDGLTGSGTLGYPGSGTMTYIVGANNASSTFSGTIDGLTGYASTNAALVKSGTGALTLNGTLNYSGNTTISNGTIVLQTPLTSSPTINLITNTSVLDATASGLGLGNLINQTLTGIGSVSGNVNASVSYGCNITPGTAGTAGTLTVNGNVTLNNATTNVVDLAAGLTTPGGGTNDLLKVNGDLTLSGMTYVRPNFIGAGTVTFGVPYTIIQYTGALTGDTNNLALDTANYPHLGAVFSTSTAGAVTVTFTGTSNLVWRGDSTNSWQVGVVTNWYDGSGSNIFGQLDKVTFDDTASNATVILNGTLTPLAVTVNNAASNYIFGGSGSISGSTSFVKKGAGSLTISNTTANTFSGETVVSNGIIQLARANVLSANSNLRLESAGAVQLGGFATSIGGLTGSGGIDNSGTAASVLTIGSVSDSVWSGSISNSGTGGVSIILNGTNNLVVSGANKLNSATASRINNGTGTMVLTNTGSILGAGEFWIGCEGAVTGKVVVAGGSLTITNWIVVGRNNTNANGTLVVNSGTVQKTGANNIVVGSLGATGTLTVNGGQVLNNGMLWIGEAPFAKATVNLNGGLLQATQVRTNYNGGAPDTSIINFNGGTLQASAASANFLSVYAANVQNGGAILDDGGFAISVLQPLLASGTGGLTKQGAGTVYLDGVNTYTGATMVTNGTLAGTGTIASAVTVGPAAKLGAGEAAAVGKLTINNTVNLAGGAALRINKTGGVKTNDLVTGISTVNYGGTLVVTNITTDSTPLAPGDTFTLFSASTHNNNFTSVVGSAGSGLGYTFTNGVLTVVTTTATNPTNITATVSGNTLQLTWPGDHLGWTLLTNSVSLTATNAWFPVPGSASATNANINLDATKTNVFFRLVYPYP